jgi:hypothetical protein
METPIASSAGAGNDPLELVDALGLIERRGELGYRRSD